LALENELATRIVVFDWDVGKMAEHKKENIRFVGDISA
jgi:hypothetical protein